MSHMWSIGIPMLISDPFTIICSNQNKKRKSKKTIDTVNELDSERKFRTEREVVSNLRWLPPGEYRYCTRNNRKSLLYCHILAAPSMTLRHPSTHKKGTVLLFFSLLFAHIGMSYVEDSIQNKMGYVWYPCKGIEWEQHRLTGRKETHIKSQHLHTTYPSPHIEPLVDRLIS